jgi:hypothetical protein
VQIAFYFHSHGSGSPDVSSGWYIDDVEVITGPIVFNNPEGFESGIGDWASERGTWEVGSPTSGPGAAYNGQNCAATRLNGNYAEPVDSRIISPSIVVPTASQNPRLRFCIQILIYLHTLIQLCKLRFIFIHMVQVHLMLAVDGILMILK